LGEHVDETPVEDLILKAAEKMVKLYSLVDENNEVKISIVEKFRAYPPTCSIEAFESVRYIAFSLLFR